MSGITAANIEKALPMELLQHTLSFHTACLSSTRLVSRRFFEATEKASCLVLRSLEDSDKYPIIAEKIGETRRDYCIKVGDDLKENSSTPPCLKFFMTQFPPELLPRDPLPCDLYGKPKSYNLFDIAKTIEEYRDKTYRANLERQIARLLLEAPHSSEIDFSNQFITILPSEIGLLTTLEALGLSHNLLRALPSEIGLLIKLKSLDVSYNLLRALPSEIGLLTELTECYILSNKLIALPSEIGRLAKLTYLNASDNLLTALPTEIGLLTELTECYVSNNLLATLPSEIGRLAKLTSLYVSDNQLTALPAEIGLLTKLKVDISRNPYAES